MWKRRLLSNNQLYFHFCSSMLGSLFYSLPEGTVMVTFSGSFSFISCKGEYFIAFTFASSSVRRLSVSSRAPHFSLNPEILFPVKDWLYTSWEDILRTMNLKYSSCSLNLDSYLPLSPKFYQNLVIKLYCLMHVKLGQSMLGCSGGGLKCQKQWINSAHNFHQLTGISAVHRFHIEATDLHFF